MIISQLSIFVENKAGHLAEITNLLAKENIDIRALSIADTTNFGILRLIVNKPEEAMKALQKDGLTVKLTDVIAVAIPDEPGGLAKAVQVLADNGITVEYLYAFLNPKEATAFVIIRVEDNLKAIDVLSANGIDMMSSMDLYSL